MNGSSIAAARPASGLVYVSDTMPGIRRRRRGKGFAYRLPDGRPLADRAELARIKALAIPPAYVDVWICPLGNGHLQATGRDARGRKQYRYHADWRLARDETKFGRLLEFGAVLPPLRRRVSRDLRAPAPTRDAVLAALVRLLDTTLLRIGNDEYARENRSYGLTTLRNRHADVRGARLQLRFRGKSGVQHDVRVDDPRVARIVRRCQDLPGQELFQWVDGEGETHRVGSADVNDYLREVTGADFTAKDFRTWHASAHALELLAARGSTAEGAADRAPSLREVLETVAQRLGNTPAVCRKAYVHPQVLALAENDPGSALEPGLGPLSREKRLLAFLGREARRARRK